jgi:predicted metal-dependent phosphoesterase TrpH
MGGDLLPDLAGSCRGDEGMTARLGRADLHIHSLASDGTAGIIEILDHVEHQTELDVIAITDHERLDAALAARSIARDRGLRAEVIVGEEVSTLGGHLLALFIEERIRPLRSLRTSIAEIHEQGGLAIPAHPLVPYPLCAQGWVLRRLIRDPDERVRPDAIEAFNPTTLGRPWHRRVVRFADEHGLARVGSSDAHAAAAIGTGWTSFPGRTAEELRAAILDHQTHHHGSFHGTGSQLSTFGRQLRKYGRDIRDSAAGRVRRDGTGRDLGYPGGRHRPPRLEEALATERVSSERTPREGTAG